MGGNLSQRLVPDDLWAMVESVLPSFRSRPQGAVFAPIALRAVFTAVVYVRGLLAPLELKNGWMLAEEAGELCPDGMQRLLNQADWDADAIRDEVRGFVLEHLGTEDGVLAVDETGCVKKGTRSAGGQRQYTGTSGKIDNCQVGAFLAYASEKGRR